MTNKHYKITELFQRNPEFEAYAQYLKDIRKELPKRSVSKEQCESTKKCLARDPKDDELWHAREINLEKAIVPIERYDIEGRPIWKNNRQISSSEFQLFQSNRESAKNYEGCSEKSATTEEKKEKAIYAFRHTPPAPLSDLEIKQLTNAESIKEIKEIKEEWRPLTFWQAVWHKIKGNKIRRDIK